MKSQNYRIVPLATEVAEEARRMAKAGAADHVTSTVTSTEMAPCRHCLQWAKPGENVVLFPYASIPAGRPYSETRPVFVHVEACQRYARADAYPADFRSQRVLRAYNKTNDMTDAVVIADDRPEPVIEELFQNPETEFLQARSVTHGCYTFRIERS